MKIDSKIFMTKYSQNNLNILLRKYSRYIKVVIIIIIFLVASYIVLSLGVFNVSKVNLYSSNRGDLLYVSRELEYEIKDIVIGENYFTVSKDILQQTLYSDPYVEYFWIEKKMPSEVYIYVVEKNPSYYITDGSDRCALLDENAFTLEIGDGEDMCSILLDKVNDIVKVEVSPFPVFEAKQQSSFYYALNISDIKKILSTYSMNIESTSITDGVSTIRLTTGQEAVFSFNQDLERQLARFVIILEQVRARNLEYTYLDLRYERPVIREK